MAKSPLSVAKSFRPKRRSSGRQDVSIADLTLVGKLGYLLVLFMLFTYPMASLGWFTVETPDETPFVILSFIVWAWLFWSLLRPIVLAFVLLYDGSVGRLAESQIREGRYAFLGWALMGGYGIGYLLFLGWVFGP
jgi:hypothetical protein